MAPETSTTDQSLNERITTMTTLTNTTQSPIVRALHRSGLLAEDVDYHIVRASMVIMFLFFGYQKWFPYEFERLVPFISNGPLIWWLYPVFGHAGPLAAPAHWPTNPIQFVRLSQDFCNQITQTKHPIAQMISRRLRLPGINRHPKEPAGSCSRTTHLEASSGRSGSSAERAW